MKLSGQWSRRRAGDAPLSSDLRAVRQAAILFVAAGTIGLITDFLPGAVGNGSKPLDAINLFVGLLALTRVSSRLTGYRSLVFPLLGMVGIALNNAAGTLPAPTLGIWFVLVFLWVGSWHRRGTCLAMAPFAVAAYLAPYLGGAPRGPDVIGSVILIIPVAVLAGEVIAANAGRSRELAREQQRAVEALAKANLTDDLTQLGNRRFGNQLLDGVEPGDVVAVLDLDHFKTVNDRFGHARGDQILQELGACLRAQVRTSDGVARMGGEEFLLIVRQAPPGQAFQSVDRVVSAWRAGSPLSTLSAGVAIHVAGQSPSDTYRAADQALYAAKTAGRDRTLVAGGPAAIPVQA
ncbi:MAG TPA: GGDEF domain-containing protein [Mycobacteriales bacterium]|nr:GGDEF domain-containing protein [Mycobacteriales bacterium]